MIEILGIIAIVGLIVGLTVFVYEKIISFIVRLLYYYTEINKDFIEIFIRFLIMCFCLYLIICRGM